MGVRNQPREPAFAPRRTKGKVARKNIVKTLPPRAPAHETKLVNLARPVVPREAQLPGPERDRTSYDGDSAIKLYLREIGQVKLLTPKEEIELAAKIKR